MARIRKCDRCNKTYEPYEGTFNSVGISEYDMDNQMHGISTDYDLCPTCAAEFKSWFETHGKYLDV